jgi:hypothetical protein
MCISSAVCRGFRCDSVIIMKGVGLLFARIFSSNAFIFHFCVCVGWMPSMFNRIISGMVVTWFASFSTVVEVLEVSSLGNS